jgi:hypothetical protein
MRAGGLSVSKAVGRAGASSDEDGAVVAGAADGVVADVACDAAGVAAGMASCALAPWAAAQPTTKIIAQTNFAIVAPFSPFRIIRPFFTVP